MIELLFAFVISNGGPALGREGAQIAPTEIVAGRQQVSLRRPLVARTADTKLVMFVRDQSTVTGLADNQMLGFEEAIPMGSVTARLRGRDGEVLEFVHTDYIYQGGFSGLVLTERAPGARQAMYTELEIESAHALPAVRFVWLDRAGRNARELSLPN